MVMSLFPRFFGPPCTQGDSDIISMPAGFRCHLVGKTLVNVFHCDIAETRFVGKLVIKHTFSQTNGLNVIQITG